MNDLPDDKKKKSLKGSSAPTKEHAPSRGKQEVTPITEFTRKVDIEPEVEGWLEKLEKEESKLQKPITDDKGQVVLQDADDDKADKGFKVVLPMTKEEVEKGLHHKVMDSVRWLAEWCVRMIKKFHGKVVYKKK